MGPACFWHVTVCLSVCFVCVCVCFACVCLFCLCVCVCVCVHVFGKTSYQLFYIRMLTSLAVETEHHYFTPSKKNTHKNAALRPYLYGWKRSGNCHKDSLCHFQIQSMSGKNWVFFPIKVRTETSESPVCNLCCCVSGSWRTEWWRMSSASMQVTSTPWWKNSSWISMSLQSLRLVLNISELILWSGDAGRHTRPLPPCVKDC